MRTKSSKSAITGLTVNEEEFCRYLAKGYDYYTAHCTVFGVGTATKKSKMEMSARLAAKSKIVSYLERLKDESRVRGAIDRDWIIDKLKELTEVGMERTQVLSVKRKKRDGEWDESTEERWLEKHIDAPSANSALDKIIKMGGLYAAEKVEAEVTTRGKFVLNLKDRTDK